MFGLNHVKVKVSEILQIEAENGLKYCRKMESLKTLQKEVMSEIWQTEYKYCLEKFALSEKIQTEDKKCVEY